MEQLDLNQVRMFVRLVELGSFTKAAAALKQPKSRVSRWLQNLEQDLGVQLIYRTTRQFQLTESGRSFYERAKNLVEGLDSLTHEMRESTAEVSGLIRVTASDDMGIKLLPTVIDDFLKIYPSVRFDIILTQAYLDLVKESVDVAIRVGTLADSTLRGKKIGVAKSILVATPGFLERHRNWEDLNEFIKLPFIGLSHLNIVNILKPLGTKAKKDVQEILLANNPALLVEFALKGRGIALVPEFLCRDHVLAGRLVHVHKTFKTADIPVSLLTPHQKEMPLRIKKFIEFATLKLKDAF
ncbi:transcriptional regulator [Bdellovibrio bacteriovorus W]|nr:transcriptional regulator [Bdellovibrio bacteriovorus W]